jgi:peptidoglycan-N-acetylglucosamine deacetylase
MKYGSVKFYKQSILASIATMIVVPITLCIFFAVEMNQLSEELVVLKTPDSRLTLDEQWIASAVDSAFIQEMDEEPSFEYQKLFPNLYVERVEEFDESIEGSVYLTFDDGPSIRTSEILDVLKHKDVKATFFVMYNESRFAADMLRRIVAEGHTVGVHTTTHIYKQIYSSEESFLKDFEKTAVWIEEVTGVKPEIFRFPGGSINKYNQCIYQTLIAEMLRRGYVFYDWNVASGDAIGATTVQSIISNVLQGVNGKGRAIVLMHDSESKIDTSRALPELIDRLKTSGHAILPLYNTVQPVTFSYVN